MTGVFQVFDVQLNGMHTIVESLDIFAKVGRGVAHDEIIPFSVKKGEIIVNGEKSSLESNRMRVEFVKVFFCSTFYIKSDIPVEDLNTMCLRIIKREKKIFVHCHTEGRILKC